ncbi:MULTISPECIES: sigma-54-dependent transcriptional regulator [Thermoanaerobacter]|uniref:sigma-54-dependent transcriptional regulator n=1 Tax=Thermoanaerobacter TaxID=1754 RepID=UPI0005733ECA|nr:sigma-54 dependent transcriptional regulator [Thermoanaerobacter sp. YS13]KHO62770.1 Response regulator containing CheY-like receiver, AAA-type ATPase, and DNA-binding domain [Thermoanaerobacter sp. YS13]
MNYKVLIIDDELAICNALKLSFESEGYNTIFTLSAREALSKLEHFSPDIVILDLRLPDMNGLSLLLKIKNFNEDIIVIIITAFGDTSTAVEAIKKGAYDFITKPFDINELKIAVKHALEEQALKKESIILKSQSKKTSFITQDPNMLQILAQIDLIASSDSTVLIQGETGTGKELIARMIHEKSPRAQKPFIAVNCGSIPSPLFESELFGHEKNAFTGASERKKGLLELADKGTFFLDEIGELPLELQSKFLRFLEEKKIRRVGGLTNFPVDTRIIAATNKNLKREVEAYKFRSDLYYRLNTIQLNIPPLRERPKDIPLLVEHYRQIFNRQFKKNIKGFSPKALYLLENYSWPGNVRELKNIMERIFILAQKDIITEKELPLDFITTLTNPQNNFKKEFLTLAELEKQHINKALTMTSGNITKAAELLGISRFALQRRIQKYNIR